jgi:hypothetical protein
MIIDALLCFDPPGTPRNLAQVVAAYDSQNILDLGVTSGIPSSANGGGARDIGIGDDPAMKLWVQVITAFTSNGAATMSVTLQGAIDNGSGAPAAFSTWYVSPVYALATLAVAGNRLLNMDMPRPPAAIAVPRFLKLVYTIAGATTIAGTVAAGIVLDRDDQMYAGTNSGVRGGYPAGITVAN